MHYFVYLFSLLLCTNSNNVYFCNSFICLQFISLQVITKHKIMNCLFCTLLNLTIQFKINKSLAIRGSYVANIKLCYVNRVLNYKPEASNKVCVHLMCRFHIIIINNNIIIPYNSPQGGLWKTV